MKSPILFTGNAEQIVNISRRQFLKQFAVSGFVLAVGLPTLSFAEQKLYGVDAMPHGSVDNPLVFVAIAEDGTVTIVCHRSEMGQGIRTSLPMVVADELEADWQKVKIIQAPGDEARFGGIGGGEFVAQLAGEVSTLIVQLINQRFQLVISLRNGG